MTSDNKTPGPDSPPARVTVLVSTYKSARYLPRHLDGLLAQTIFPACEIIFVDSGSPENEGEILAPYVAQHLNIRYIRTPERETIYAAWNRAIRASHAPYILNLNTDDTLHPEALDILARTLDANPNTAIVYADSLVTDQWDLPWGQARITGRFHWPDFDPTLLFKVACLGPHPMWRRSLHQRWGLFDPSLTCAGDYEFWLRLCLTEHFQHLPTPLGLYYLAPDGIENSNPPLCLRESEAARRCHWPRSNGPRPRPEGNFLSKF